MAMVEEECVFKPCTKTHKTITIWMILKEYLKENITTSIILLCILLVIPLKIIALPHIIGKLYNAIKTNKQVILYAGLIIILIIIIQVAAILSEQIRTIVMPKIQKYARNLIIKHTFDTKTNNFDEVQTGEIQVIINKLPITIYNTIEQFRTIYIPSMITILLVFFYFLWIDWFVGIVFFIVVISFFMLLKIGFNKCIQKSIQRDKILNHMNTQVDDVLRNMLTVLNNDTLSTELDTINDTHSKYADKLKETLNCILPLKCLAITAAILFLLYICYYVVVYKYKKKQNISEGISIIIVTFVVVNTIMDVTSYMNDSIFKLGLIQNSMSLFDVCLKEGASAGAGAGAGASAGVGAGIVIKNVHFSYTDDKPVFENLNLVFEKGKVNIIVGQNGKGKTTLLFLLLKLYEPSCGMLYIDGTAYSDINDNDLRKQIGYIPQNPVLFNRSIYANITYGISNVSEHDVRRVIDEFNLAHVFDGFPEGLNTNVGLYGSHISGGQRQIILIVRQILLNSNYIIMDEPTSAIDEENKANVVSIVDKLNRVYGKTFIIVTHDSIFNSFHIVPI